MRICLNIKMSFVQQFLDVLIIKENELDRKRKRLGEKRMKIKLINK